MLFVDNPTKASTAFGSILTIFVNIGKETILQTIILAAVGGVSSFLATMFVKYAIKFLKKYLHK